MQHYWEQRTYFENTSEIPRSSERTRTAGDQNHQSRTAGGLRLAKNNNNNNNNKIVILILIIIIGLTSK